MLKSLYALAQRAAAHLRWLALTSRHIASWGRALRPLVVRKDRLRLGVLTFGLIARLLVPVHVPLPGLAITLAGQRHVVKLGTHHELAGAVEVLCTSDYDTPVGNVMRVLDLGANVGFATILFAARYPNAHIVALEPAPDTFRRLKGNVGHLSRVTVLQLAAGPPGEITMDLGMPSTERRGSGSATGVRVRRISLGQLLDLLDWPVLDVLKVDIEGDEFDVLREVAASRAKVIVGELHAAAAPSDFPGLASLLPTFDVHCSSLRENYVMFRAIRRTA